MKKTSSLSCHLKVGKEVWTLTALFGINPKYDSFRNCIKPLTQRQDLSRQKEQLVWPLMLDTSIYLHLFRFNSRRVLFHPSSIQMARNQPQQQLRVSLAGSSASPCCWQTMDWLRASPRLQMRRCPLHESSALLARWAPRHHPHAPWHTADQDISRGKP